MMKKALLLASLIAVAGLAQAQTATYAIDPTHTYATFEITFDMNGISTGSSQFDTHLKSKDFFDVANNPTAKFVGDKFTFSGDKVATVAGQLTLKGKTAPVTLTATNFNCYENPMLKREVCGGDFETTFDRTAFGVDYGIQYGFSKDIKVIVQVEAVKQ